MNNYSYEYASVRVLT